jgi:hypothetical protein
LLGLSFRSHSLTVAVSLGTVSLHLLTLCSGVPGFKLRGVVLDFGVVCVDLGQVFVDLVLVLGHRSGTTLRSSARLAL